MTDSAPDDRLPTSFALTLKRQLKQGQAQLRAEYEASAHPSARGQLRGRTRQVDDALENLWRQAGLGEQGLCLIAVGGYGRRELFPASDVDLLILRISNLPARQEQHISAFVGALWDLGLHIGHSVRTIDESLQLSGEDITIQTAMLDARYLCGDTALFADLEDRYRRELNIQTFFKNKWLERDQRYDRFQGTPYALEPNVKESPGGLRDLHLLGWIARAAGFGWHWSDLISRKLLTAEEAASLRNIERTLRHVRIRLHYLTGREEDRLLFDYQEPLAKILGVRQTATRRASEMLMQKYYRTARNLMQINEILLQNYAVMFFREADTVPVFIIDEHFQAQRELLDIRCDDVFERHPEAMLKCLLILQRRYELKGLTARALRQLWLNRRRLNAAFRAKAENRALFLQLFQQKHRVTYVFERMNQYGLLGQYLPVWQRIVGQMQYDLFHVYTVDQHTLTVLRNVRRFSYGEHIHEYPLMSQLMAGFERSWVICIAALFHDIAKGRKGDHSLLGMEVARHFCRQHALDKEDAELIVWLVEHHLDMSRVAQKQDISDPDVIRRFAGQVGNERRLVALYALTHADIRGTSPKVWNGWRSKLLEDLFLVTRRHLRGASPQQALEMDQRLDNARMLLRLEGVAQGSETALWKRLDQVFFMRNSAEEIAWETRMLYDKADSGVPVVKARMLEGDSGIQVLIYTSDQHELFKRITGFFERHGFSVLEARIHTTSDDYALDTFILRPVEHIGADDAVALIEQGLTEQLNHPELPLRSRSGRLSRQVRFFPIVPSIGLRPDEAGKFHTLSLVAADRPGLLFGVADLLARYRIEVETAKITTLGERAEDYFLLSGPGLLNDAALLKFEQELFDFLLIDSQS